MGPPALLSDPLAAEFPLPYRVLCLIAVGLLAWAVNLHGLHFMDIDAVAALDLRTEGYAPRLPISITRRASIVGAHPHGPPHARTLSIYSATPLVFHDIYRACASYSAIIFASWIVYRFASRGEPQLADAYGWIPALTALLVVVLFLWPRNAFHRVERRKFIHAVQRCLFSSANTPVLFADVIFADIWTSFAKVLGDVWLSLCMLLPGNSLLNPPPQVGLSQWILPSIMSLPYLARFRQCVIEYNLESNTSTRPLFNAIKYATAFPVMYLSAAQGMVLIDQTRARGDGPIANHDPWQEEYRERLFHLWLVAVFINSLYSFWWDTTNDWGLELLKWNTKGQHGQHQLKKLTPPRLVRSKSRTPLLDRSLSAGSGSEASDTDHDRKPTLSEDLKSVHHRHTYSGALSHIAITTSHSFSPALTTLAEPPAKQRAPWGLRHTRLFPNAVYPTLVAMNLVLRFAWALKLATHLHASRDGSLAIFGLELAEIFRRWLWVFLRVEWEVIKKMEEGEPAAKPLARSLPDMSEEDFGTIKRVESPPPLEEHQHHPTLE